MDVPLPKRRRHAHPPRRTIPELSRKVPGTLPGVGARTPGAASTSAQEAPTHKRVQARLERGKPAARPTSELEVVAKSRAESSSVGPVRRHTGLLRHNPLRLQRDTPSTFEDAWKSLPMTKVVGVRIGLMTDEDVRKEGGNREVTSHGNGDKSKTSTIYDTRMGPTSLTVKCDTCSTFGCVGHFGIIDLKKPHFSPLQIKNLVLILRCICASSS